MENPAAQTLLQTLSPAERLHELRRRHPRFVYEKASYERVGDLRGGQREEGIFVNFHFRLEPDIEFTPRIWIRRLPWKVFESVPKVQRDNFAFHLGLIEALSYWKAACSPEIVVLPEALTDEQIDWWHDLLLHGMGEYFYVNQIDFRPANFVRIVAPPSRRPTEPAGTPALQARDLVLVSGGKDSVVTLELLREAGRPFDCLLLNPTPAALAIAKQAGCEKPIIVHRTIDPRLLELNAQGYLNGHTPFSALLALLGVAVAALGGYSRVIVSNERSAEEAGVEYLGHAINHQYSKTLRFESAFREYSKKYLTPGVEYFSLLRPLYELQIARLFARHSQYFPLFRSCNRGMASNSWCGRCPKCLFVYTVLYPFLKRAEVLGIFGADLFAWEGAGEVLRALLGLDKEKPFECVGTREETLAAIHLCVERYRGEQVALPPALQAMQESVLSGRGDLPQLAQRILTSWSDQHFLPRQIAERLQRDLRP
jgi:hypothetical protein